VGPASLELFLATAAPEADITAVIADAWPDGFAHAVGIGRLRTSYPDIVPERSVSDANGEIVQPYPDHSVKTPATPGEVRKYHVEFWPLGNRFQAGHRLRLYLVGAPAYMLPASSLNLVSVGGDTPSRLLLPMLPDGDLHDAIADTR
jgi:predicted acyl esterase